MWIPFETPNFRNNSQLEQRSLSCFLELHKLLVSFRIYIGNVSGQTSVCESMYPRSSGKYSPTSLAVERRAAGLEGARENFDDLCVYTRG